MEVGYNLPQMNTTYFHNFNWLTLTLQTFLESNQFIFELAGRAWQLQNKRYW